MSHTGFERDIPLVSVNYTVVLARFLRRHGIAAPTLLEGTGVPLAALQDPEAYLTIAQTERVIARATTLVPRPALGFEYGLELDLSAHGLLGFSVLRRASVRELTRMLVDYLRIRLPLMELSLAQHANTAELRVEPSWEFPLARQFIVEAYMGSIYALAAPALRDIELCFGFPRPRTVLYERLVRCPVSYDHPASHLRVQLGVADTRPLDLRQTPLYAHQSARAELQEEGVYGIALRVRHCIMRDPGRHSTLEGVAAELGLSPRSLRRHLQAGGESFTDIRNRIRRQFAIRYLRGSNLSLEAIAGRLGYGDQASFTRAFREWTGTSPGRFRRNPEAPEPDDGEGFALAAGIETERLPGA